MSHGCGCGNSNNTNRCGNCDECSAADVLNVCQAGQIEQLKKRTDQLAHRVECLNLGEPFDILCPVQNCVLPECTNTGTVCDGKSPTGNPVGSNDLGCGESNVSQDCCDELGSKVRKLEQEVTRIGRQNCEIKARAIKEVLLDSGGNVRGGLTLQGKIVNFTAGSWELAVAAAEE